ncbi:hypothetical protein [Pyrolobus fumarii]|uniref:hypothetical protein n=1 Tax=Pyrolobus fumarii TaxID=54252 RepID=UPI001FCBAF46|nr:hypothetical protein [Pyrolobus fumarii]
MRCTRCGRTWILEVSFDLASMGKLYHFCPHCRRNAFHEVLQRIEDDIDIPIDGKHQQGEYSSSTS